MPQIDLLAAERQAAILDRIRKNGRVLAGKLALEFETSEDTIRRALRNLATRGHCKRVYGGAIAVAPASSPLTVRCMEALDRKAALGAVLASVIKERQFVYIDGGTTNLAAARLIPENFKVTVATQDPAIGAVLATREDITLIMIGGQVKPHLGSSVGVEATRQMMGLRPDLLLLGVCAVDAQAGVSAFDPEDAAFKQFLVKNSRHTVTAVLNEKLGCTAPFLVCSIKAVETLVVEFNAPRSATKPFAAREGTIRKAKTIR